MLAKSIEESSYGFLNTKGTHCANILPVKPLTWNTDKNKLLQTERNISFEEVVYHIAAGGILDTLQHPNQERYPGQQIHVVDIEGYAYLVPFIESEDEVFLKTIIPSRKATKTYLGDPK